MSTDALHQWGKAGVRRTLMCYISGERQGGRVGGRLQVRGRKVWRPRALVPLVTVRKGPLWTMSTVDCKVVHNVFLRLCGTIGSSLPRSGPGHQVRATPATNCSECDRCPGLHAGCCMRKPAPIDWTQSSLVGTAWHTIGHELMITRYKTHVDQPRIQVWHWRRRAGNTEHCVAKGEAANAVQTGEGPHSLC